MLNFQHRDYLFSYLKCIWPILTLNPRLLLRMCSHTEDWQKRKELWPYLMNHTKGFGLPQPTLWLWVEGILNLTVLVNDSMANLHSISNSIHQSLNIITIGLFTNSLLIVSLLAFIKFLAKRNEFWSKQTVLNLNVKTKRHIFLPVIFFFYHIISDSQSLIIPGIIMRNSF